MNQLEKVSKVANDTLDRLPKLPCRVDEMTEREYKIFEIVAVLTGSMRTIRDLTEND